MKLPLPSFARTTTFRLAVVHAVVFLFFTFGLLIYLFYSTAGYMRSQSVKELDGEVQALAAAFNSGGMDRLNQSVVERSSVPGPYFYVLQDPFGDTISGDFATIPDDLPVEGSRETNFTYQTLNRNGEVETRSANGIIIRLPNDANLMVAYDLGTRRQIVDRITRTVWTALPIGLAMSLIGGFLISRSAAQRAEQLTRTTDGIISGDLSRRAPVVGSGDEFDRLSERLNAMLDKLEHLMMTTRHAGDAIAHDLRSPLTRLRNRLEADLRDGDEADREESLERTIAEVDAVLATFNAILSLSRIQAGDAARFDTVDVSLLASELCELYEPAAEDDNLGFATEIEPGVSITGERSLIAQAMTNLLDNAIKYTPAGGALTLRVRTTADDHAEISVTDTGPGIPAEDRERATKRFVRLEASRTQPGNGLGLAMVDAIARLHRGNLELSDGPGEPPNTGLRAALILPKP
ncbi:HAMP domain-containing sensor histidine kinase [Ponticaulis sp.]|uniref:sensor histidine kinase n=1 Tax=Ponticaulis sp. TaxID=2020902 RepID=UPI000B637219|nr:HAMP domain-containing sensor histidine kinase [Ponticaulis sp.]MAI90426.1 two-component sensor histidine kinase [Ponticaulis sp.]OUY00127.1 MAG: two-component sensor histidine kinase [Hyphomonadaceae bacterium TMED5]|tara:strand:- start:42099 stop:43490 length:1392 start_codon:yes stop_codon:yes gene_type:complete